MCLLISSPVPEERLLRPVAKRITTSDINLNVCVCEVYEYFLENYEP